MTTTLLAPRTPSRSRLPSLVEETGRPQSGSAGSTPPSPSLAGGSHGANTNTNANTNTGINMNINMNGSGSLSASGLGDDSTAVRLTSMSQPPSHSASVSSATHPHNLLVPTNALGDSSRRGSAYSAHPHRRSVVSTLTTASHAPMSAPYAPSVAGSLPLHAPPTIPRTRLVDSLRSLGRAFAPFALSYANSRTGSAVHSIVPASPAAPSPAAPHLVSIGACAAAVAATVLALLAHALCGATPVDMDVHLHNGDLGRRVVLPLLVPLLAVVLILASALDWYRTKELASFVRRVALSLNLVAFFGVWLLHPVWVVWLVPAVLFPLLFAPKYAYNN